MSDFRIRYGSAIGPYGTAAATSSRHLLTPGDTTPDVTHGTFFVTANTSATTITYFDVYAAGGAATTAANGKRITLLFQDAVTTIQNGGNLYLADTQGALPANSTLELLYYNSAWVETARGHNDQTPQVPAGAMRSVSYSFSGTAAGSLLNVTTADRLYITVSALASVVQGFSGGRSDQAIDLQVIGIGSTVFLAQSAGVLQLPGTDTALISNSATYRFVTRNGVLWNLQGGFVA